MKKFLVDILSGTGKRIEGPTLKNLRTPIH